METLKYPTTDQENAVSLVNAAHDVVSKPDLYSRESLLCAANYLEERDDGCQLLLSIAKYYREKSSE